MDIAGYSGKLRNHKNGCQIIPLVITTNISKGGLELMGRLPTIFAKLCEAHYLKCVETNTMADFLGRGFCFGEALLGERAWENKSVSLI